MKTTLPTLCLLLAASCTAEIGDPGAPGEPSVTPDPSQPAGPVNENEWDEARAPDAQPCGTANLETCEAETRGACGVVAPGGGDDLCLPLFNWGVTRDDRIEFASAARRFTIADLAASPLTSEELDEAATMVESYLSSTSADEGDAADEGSLEPLASWNHSGICSPTYFYCSSEWITRFTVHYNRDGRHVHQVMTNHNLSAPWYQCNKPLQYFSVTWDCGTAAK